MTAVFENVNVCLDDVGEFMKQYAKEHSIKYVPGRLLVRSYFGKKIGLSTPLIKWYLNHGRVITHIYTVAEYIPDTAFNSFMTQVAQARLDGDHDKDKALIAETMKLIGNSGYGELVYVNESEIGTEIMDRHFYSLTELPNDYYKVQKTKKKINLNLPIHKLLMLEFYHNFWTITYHVKTLRS